MQCSKTLVLVPFALGLLCLARSAAAAGSVTATIDPKSGVVRVTGDASDNDIEITSDGDAYVVTGRNGTAVNEGTSATFAGGRTLALHMGAGADRVDLTGVRVRGDLRAYLEDGSDTIVLTDSRVQGRAVFRGGDGDDRIAARDGTIFRNLLVVKSDRGNDTVELADTDVQERSGIQSGAGDDTITFDFCVFRDDIRIQTRDGEDLVEAQVCDFDDDVDIGMGDDDDKVVFDDSLFDKDVYVDGGSGHDDRSTRSGTRFDRIPAWRSFED